MKKKHLLLSAAAGIIYLTVSSFSGGTFGTQGNLTGGGGATNTCANCHMGGAGATTGSIEVRLKSAGATSMPVDKYEAGEVYLVTLTGSNATLTHFGFQLMAHKKSDNTLMGTFSNAPASTQLSSSDKVAEHSAAIMQNGSGQFEVTFDWTAPTTGAGDITFNGIINAVNNNGGSTGNIGDDPSGNISKTLRDATSVATVKNVTVFKAYPNPVINELTLDMELAQTGTYSVRVFNATGHLVTNQDVVIKPNGYKAKINTSNWATGIHFVQISHEGDQRVLTVMKQ